MPETESIGLTFLIQVGNTFLPVTLLQNPLHCDEVNKTVNQSNTINGITNLKKWLYTFMDVVNKLYLKYIIAIANVSEL